MGKAPLLAALLCLGCLASAWAADVPAVSTTLAAETGNNTSAAPAFLAESNGNLGATNISKLPIRGLLYPGSTTRIYAHVEPWWGSAHHIDIGYSSQDPSQVHRQVADMISRGLDGAVLDWYGPDSYEALGVKLFFAEAETQGNFKVFVEVEHGAVLWDSCYPTCNATTAVVQLFSRVASDFFSSPAYESRGGRPLIREFGMENIPLPSGQTDLTWNVVDWNTVQAQVPGNPLVIHRNLGGFAKPQSGGSFTWMSPKTLDTEPLNYDGTDELVWFYSNAIASYPTMPAFGAVWKGFNDTLADWSPPGGRHIEQNCGQTWLRTFATANLYYSAGNQLAVLQLVTWNDYEEGTELESGIDNCVSLSAAVAGSTLQWVVSGDESTLDHYTVFLSSDGENLAQLGQVPAGTHVFDFSGFSIPAGSYALFVKAVAKPSLINRMSSAVTLTIAPPPPPPAPVSKDVTISAAPTSMQVTRGETAQFSVSLTETGASDPVTLSCSNLPAGMACSFAPATVTPGAGTMSVALSITTSAVTAAAHAPLPREDGHGGWPLLAWWLPGAVGVCLLPVLPGISSLGSKVGAPRYVKMKLTLFCLLALLGLLSACGGGGAQRQTAASQPPTTVSTAPPATYTIALTATSGTVTRSTTVNLMVQ